MYVHESKIKLFWLAQLCTFSQLSIEHSNVDNSHRANFLIPLTTERTIQPDIYKQISFTMSPKSLIITGVNPESTFSDPSQRTSDDNLHRI
jgi:hypothetical protein